MVTYALEHTSIMNDVSIRTFLLKDQLVRDELVGSVKFDAGD